MTLSSLAAIALLAATPAKKKNPSNPATDAAIKKVLDGEQERVSQCIVASAPPPPWEVKVSAKLTVNAAGQVLGVAVAGANDAQRACLEQLLKAVTFAKSQASVTTVSREWSFALK